MIEHANNAGTEVEESNPLEKLQVFWVQKKDKKVLKKLAND